MITRVSVLLVAAVSFVWAQQRPQSFPNTNSTTPALNSQTSSRDILRVNDQLVISAKDVQGMVDRPYRIDADGTVTLPLIGKVRGEGLTVEELEKELTAQFRVYVRSPQVSVKRLPPIAETASNTFVVAGAFKNPGVYPLSDRRGLLDAISTAGGLQPNAARRIRITRRLGGGRNGLAGGAEDLQTGTAVASVNLSRLMENPSLRDDIVIEPGDVLYAEPAVVYLTGQVMKPGSFDLTDRDSFGLTELIALGGGLTRDAAPQKAMVLRQVLGGSKRAEIALDAKSILAGQQTDFRILPSDIVVIPETKSRLRTVGKVAVYVVPAMISALIYLAVR